MRRLFATGAILGALALCGCPAWAVGGPLPATPACKEFARFALKPRHSLTEGLVVVKDGQLRYEWYDSKYGPDQPHILWSATKTITGALLGIAVRDGKVRLDQTLSEFFPRDSENYDPNYEKIRVSNLFYMDSGFAWDEYYSGDVSKSPVLWMLFGPGRTDMARFAASRPIIAEGPGYQWSYSTGTSVMLMAVLKKAYGADYERMPWRELFEPLGMSNVAFERDASGTFIGGSYAHATPRDMAKLGQLYLDRGRWNGKVILPEDWIDKTLTPSPGFVSPGTVITDFTDGVFGGAMWLNRAAGPRREKPHASSPGDMFYALGHHGQLITVFPSQNMVIARTGWDELYSNKLDAFASRAVACFAGENVRPGKVVPVPKALRPSLGKSYETVRTALKLDIAQGALAKSVCSCVFVSKVDLKTCVKRSNIPLATLIAKVKLERGARNRVSVGLTWLGRLIAGHDATVVAELDLAHPEFGCALPASTSTARFISGSRRSTSEAKMH